MSYAYRAERDKLDHVFRNLWYYANNMRKAKGKHSTLYKDYVSKIRNRIPRG